jgi:hypothetical protein
MRQYTVTKKLARAAGPCATTPGPIFWAALSRGLGGEGQELIALLADYFR